MPDPELPFFQSPQPSLRHLPIPIPPQRVDAAGGSRMRSSFQSVDRRQHGRALADRIYAIKSELDELAIVREQTGLPREVDLILELDSAPGFNLSADQIHALSTGSDIQVLFARLTPTPDGQRQTKVLLHVPYGNLTTLADKFRQFAEETTQAGNTPNPWVANIQRLGRAALESMWTDPDPMPEGDEPQWWQLWVRRSEPNWETFLRFSNSAGLHRKDERLTLPDHYVVIVHARRSQLESSIDLLNTLAEVRAARLCHLELSELSAEELQEWIEDDYAYPNSNHQSPVEDPAQAWNALTVGAITHRHRILEADPESTILTPIASDGALSPHSRTSLTWDSHWPIKPDIVMEGGNLGQHPEHGPERRDSLDVLTTSRRVRGRPIIPFRATSAATALAARLAAGIRAQYPDLWPETVRGLIVHSSRWNERMLDGADPHRPGTSSAIKQAMCQYGYGEPNPARAQASSQCEVTLFRQDEFTPYRGSAGQATVNDCHIHQLRLPAALLQSLGNMQCMMRVTLSYFTAPNPSASNQIRGSRYRYGGCLLRFRVRHRDESEQNFMSLVARAAEDENGDQEEVERNYDSAWALGPSLRAKGGSLIHDVWRGAAADLVTMDRIAVFPVKGWWAFRSFPTGTPWHRCHQRTIRYSLIVSIEVMADVHLYTEISNLLSVPLDAT